MSDQPDRGTRDESDDGASEPDRGSEDEVRDGAFEPTPVDRVMPDIVDPDDVYAEFIETHEQRLDDQRANAIEAGRRKGGVAGAAMAGAMFAVAEIYEGPKKDDKPVTVEASSDPDDVDRDGIDVSVGDVDVGAPALPTLGPVVDRANQRKHPQV